MMCNLVHCSVVAHVLQEPREGLQWNDSFSLQACFCVTVSTVLKKSVPGERVLLQLSWALHLLETLVYQPDSHELHLEDAAAKHILFTI